MLCTLEVVKERERKRERHLFFFVTTALNFFAKRFLSIYVTEDLHHGQSPIFLTDGEQFRRPFADFGFRDSKQKMRIASLFSGAGALDYGLEQVRIVMCTAYTTSHSGGPSQCCNPISN